MAFSLYERWILRKSELVTEFYSYIEELLQHDMVMELDNYIHHYCFTRLKHSLDVAYFSFFVAKLLHWDCRSVARAGLLHDLFHYIRKEENFGNSSHTKVHPALALENAKNICDLNKVEEDIILKHMWLATPVPPRYKEGYIVTFVDKFCAVTELTKSLFTRSRLRALNSGI